MLNIIPRSSQFTAFAIDSGLKTTAFYFMRIMYGFFISFDYAINLQSYVLKRMKFYTFLFC